MPLSFSCYATCPKGVEDLLTWEMEQLGVPAQKQSVGVVYFTANHRQIYQMCLWSRVASRVFLSLLSSKESLDINSELALYSQVREIAWETHLQKDGTIAVDFVGQNRAINNTQFGAVRVKDAVVDRMRDQTGERPSVSRADPDLRIQVRLNKDRIQVGLDLSGGGLHKRGYRAEQGAAPLRENLAAAILMRCGWHLDTNEFKALLDPMCGSGTFLIEAAMMQMNRAPGLDRRDFGFIKWQQFDAQVWPEVLSEAQQRYQAGKSCGKPIIGADRDKRMVEIARANIARAGLTDFIDVRHQDLSTPVVFEGEIPRGLLVCNPPYGERLGEVEALKQTYLDLAHYAKNHYGDWQMAVFTGNRDLAQEMRMRPKKINKLSNGAIACELLLYDILPESKQRLRVDVERYEEATLSDGAKMVFNRLQKNLRKLSAWLKKSSTNAYRIYDADLPEYAAAIDYYAGRLHVQEYVAPKSIPADQAAKRFRELLTACSAAFECPVADIAVKQRQVNKGLAQYEKQGASGETFEVSEGSAKYWVNLHDYLDTGLFLDHRPLRKIIQEQVRGKRFLNLFCYTGSITVAAGLGGAQNTVSVDMSHTYLNWAEKNLALNDLKKARHSLIQADCFKWLAECREGFDIIVMDPPSFSNSKRMDKVLDVQKDHVALIKRCMELLTADGVLYFSNNLRGFKLNYSELERYQIDDITADTIDKDFERNSKIHCCFTLRHKRN